MPPPETHKKVSLKELELLKQWIKEGAQYDDPWTYQNPIKQPNPEVQNKDWPINFVDYFILSQLEK